VVSIPDEVRWEISVVGGKEHVSEVHRTWGTSTGVGMRPQATL